MDRRLVVAFAVSVALVMLPSYAVERITNYYFLSHSPLFGAWSGWRSELFVIFTLSGSVVSGVLLGRFKRAAPVVVLGVGLLLFMVYAGCEPRLCYSTGMDGLEPIRMGLELSTIGVASVTLGTRMMKKEELSGIQYATFGFATFSALSYFPVVFTFAGTRLLVPFDPWAVLVFLSLLSFTITVSATRKLGVRRGLILVTVSEAVVTLLTGTIAVAYLYSIEFPTILMIAGMAAGDMVGARLGKSPSVARVFAGTAVPAAILILLVLSMTVVEIPDAVAGVAPVADSATNGVVMAVPDFAGAYMDAPLGSTKGVALTLSFAGSNDSGLREGQYIAGGIGAHSPGYYVDGIDYGYRFDAYLLHGGNVSLLASAWEICDHNAACGGHSWKVLMFERSMGISREAASASIHLAIEWKNHTVFWWYAVGSAAATNMSSFDPPQAEKPYFNTGVLPGDIWSRIQSGSYFFQFGVISGSLTEGTNWTVRFVCPAVLVADQWTCIAHAKTLQGSQSFWKALWRWGEDLPDVAVSSAGPTPTVTFHSSDTTMQSFAGLW